MIASFVKPSRKISRSNVSFSFLLGTIVRCCLSFNIQIILRDSRVLYFHRSRTLQITCDRMTDEEIYGVKLVRNIKAIEPYLEKFAINCESIEIMQRFQNGNPKRFVKFAAHDHYIKPSESKQLRAIVQVPERQPLTKQQIWKREWDKRIQRCLDRKQK